MLSSHEFVVAVRDDIYPKAKQIEQDCLDLFNKHFTPGRGQTGVRGSNEFDFTIAYLESAVEFLKRLGRELIIDQHTMATVKEIEQLNWEKEEAVANQDFDRAAALRERVDNLKKTFKRVEV